MNLPGGQIVKGREAAGKLFAGFCKDPKEGGLKGLLSMPKTALRGERIRHSMGRYRAFPRGAIEGF